jgi:hypothetical protein
LRQPLDRDATPRSALDVGAQTLGERHDLPLGTAGRDHHRIGDARFSLEIDDDDVLGLAVVEAPADDVQELLIGFGCRLGPRRRL